MALMVDARGLACPHPVIQTRKAMQEADRVVTLVDNDTALANVSRMAKKTGWQIEVTPKGEEYRIELVKASTPQTEPLAAGKSDVTDGPLVLVVPSDIMGRGGAELGSILTRSFFHALGEVEPRPQTIIFFNTGVKLVCQDSPVLDDLCALEAEGVEIVACGTCLDYLGLMENLAVGQVSNMYEIAETMLNAGKVVSL